MKRQAGFYWVRKGFSWFIAEYVCNELWKRIDMHGFCHSGTFDEIDERRITREPTPEPMTDDINPGRE